MTEMPGKIGISVMNGMIRDWNDWKDKGDWDDWDE